MNQSAKISKALNKSLKPTDRFQNWLTAPVNMGDYPLWFGNMDISGTPLNPVTFDYYIPEEIIRL